MSWIPFEEIIEGKIVEALYAADLWAVYTGRAAERYQDPNKFFERTFFTSSLKELLSNAVKRLEGDPNVNPVYLLLTGLGGGKTHSLIALYHLTKNGRLLSKATLELLRSAGLAPPSAEPVVVVFDGVQLDPIHLEKEYGGRHLWNYILEVLHRETGDTYAAEASKKYRDAVPGGEELYKILSRIEAERPLIILIDETLNYLKNLKPEDREKNAMFIQHLSKTIAQLQKSLLVVTLVDSDEGREVAKQFMANIQRVSKNESVITQKELPAVVRRALLKNVSGGANAAKELYKRYADYTNIFAQRYTEEVLAEYYPLHPSTIAVLTRLAESGAIQSTRDVLRILAWTLHSVYNDGRGGVYITPGDIPIERGEIRTLIFRDDKLRLAVEQDLADLEAVEKAAQGRECGRLFRRLYRAVALASAAETYLNEREVASYSYSPDLGISPAAIPTCLEALVGNITHLHYFTKEGLKHYAVKSKAFWRALLKKKVEEALKSDRDKYYDQLRKHLSSTNIRRVPDFEVYVWDSPPDKPKPLIVLADPRWQDPAEPIDKTKNGMQRIMRGAVIVLEPEREAVERAVKTLAEIEAAREIQRSAKDYGLDEVDVREIEKFVYDKTKELKEVASRDIYTTLTYAGGRGGITKLPIELDLQDSPDEIYRRLVKALKDDGKLADTVGPQLVKQVVDQLHQSFGTPPKFAQLVEYFGGRVVDLPLLLKPSEALKQIIKSSPDLVVIRGGEALKPDYIDENDEIATIETAEKLGLRKQPREEAPVAVDIRPTPTAPAKHTGKAANFKDLVNTLKELAEAGVTSVKITLRGDDVEQPDEMEQLLSLLKLYTGKVGEAGGRIHRLTINITMRYENNEVAKFDADIRQAQKKDIVENALEVVKSVIRTYSKLVKLSLRYSLEASGEASKLHKALDTPLMTERKVKINAELEEAI